jgi:hypothetical protein
MFSPWMNTCCSIAAAALTGHSPRDMIFQREFVAGGPTIFHHLWSDLVEFEGKRLSQFHHFVSMLVGWLTLVPVWMDVMWSTFAWNWMIIPFLHPHPIHVFCWMRSGTDIARMQLNANFFQISKIVWSRIGVGVDADWNSQIIHAYM